MRYPRLRAPVLSPDRANAASRSLCGQRAFAEALEPRRLLAADLTFAIVGDYGNNNQPEADVSALIHSWKPSFIVTTGDNNYPVGDTSTIDANIGQFYHDYIYPYRGSYGAGSADGVNHFFGTLGNHDYYTQNGQPELNYLSAPPGPGNGRYFDFVQGNVEVFVLDDNPGTPDGYTSTSVQAQWLHSELAASPAAYKLVFFHEPAYTSGVSGGRPDMRWPFKDWGATAVLCGHDHVYERLLENGLPYITDGVGGDNLSTFPTIDPGSQVRYNADYGAVLVHATDVNIEFKFITRTGALIDDYIIPNPTPQPAPTAPTGLTATAVSSGQVNLAWTNTSSTAGAIRIERSIAGGGFAQLALISPTATSYSDTTGLAPFTLYAYRIVATNSGGDSPYSNTASATTPAGSDGTLIARYSVWSYLDNGTNQGTAWRAINFDDSTWKTGAAELGYGDGDEATVVGYGPDPNNKYITTYFRRSFTLADPAAVQALALNIVRDDGAVIYLNGTEVFRTNMDPGSVSYTTLASTSIGAPQESTWYPATVPTTGLVAGKNVISVEVHQGAVDSSDISFNFELLATLVAPAQPPAAPTTLVASAVSSSQINLTWARGSTDESGFYIERSSGGGAFAQIGAAGAGATTYNDTTALPGTAYTYQVRAWNSAGTSQYSNPAVATTPPAAPTNLAAQSLSTSSIGLTWTASANATSYKIERATGAGAFAQVGTALGTDISFTDINLTPGTAYSYRIRASGAGGDSAYSNTASATTPVNAPLAPTSLGAKAISSSQITLTWTRGSTDESGFYIERSSGGGAFAQVATAAAGATTFTDSGLSPNTAYTYQIRAWNSGGDSPYSNTASDTTLVAAPLAPTNLAAKSLSTSSIGLTWTASANATSYKIERTTGTGTFAQVGTALGTDISFTDIGLTPGTAYNYRIRANNAGGDSPYSNTASATTGVNAPLAPTSLGASAISPTQITLTWTRGSTDESGFKIERSTGGGAFAQVATATAGATTFTDSGLSPSTAYTYQVRAWNAGGDSPYSNTASATTLVSAPLAPTNLVATVAASGSPITLAWVRGSTNETLFKIERSTSGGAYTQIGTAPAGSTTYQDSSGLASATTYTYRVRASNSTGDSPYSNTASATTPSPGLPAPWVDKDIGTVGKTGSASYLNGVFTVKGSGVDIWDKTDGCNFVYQSLVGDGQIIARVTSVQNTNVWAKAGVMIRESLANNARWADVVVTPSAGVAFQWRASTGGSGNTTTVSGLHAPYWVKLTRVGNTFTGYRSPDGITWTRVGSATVTMAANVYIGLAVTAHNNTALCAATFDNISGSAGGTVVIAGAQTQSASSTSQTNSVLGSQPAGVLG